MEDGEIFLLEVRNVGESPPADCNAGHVDFSAGRPVIVALYPADWSPVCGDQMALYLSCPVLPRGNATAPTCVRQRTPLWLPYIWAGRGRRFSKAPGNLHTIFALPPHRA
jgi:hypothetical protein